MIRQCIGIVDRENSCEKSLNFVLYSVWAKAASLLISREQKKRSKREVVKYLFRIVHQRNVCANGAYAHAPIFIIILALLLCHLLSKLTTMTNSWNNNKKHISVTQKKKSINK